MPRGDPGLSGRPSCHGLSLGMSGVVRGGRVVVFEVTPWTLLVRGELGQPRGVAWGGSIFTVMGTR